MIKYIKQFFSKVTSTSKHSHQLLEEFIFKITGISPKNIDLYELALKHRSLYKETHQNNERLEFLGDSILQAIVSEYLFLSYPNKNEGFMTKVRSNLVKREILTQIGKKKDIMSVMKYSKGLEKHKMKYVEGNAFEALVGAIFLDQGYVKCKDIIINKLIKPNVDINAFSSNNCPKSELIEWGQKNKQSIKFVVVNEEFKDFGIEFKVEAFINDISSGNGYGSSKKLAEQEAAGLALSKIKINN